MTLQRIPRSGSRVPLRTLPYQPNCHSTRVSAATDSNLTKFASCEDRALLGVSNQQAMPADMADGQCQKAVSNESIDSPLIEACGSKLMAAIQACEAISSPTATFTNSIWSERAAPTLEEGLRLKLAYEAADANQRKSARSYIKVKWGLKRGPNLNNIELIGVRLISSDGISTSASQKEMSRFATLIKAAAKDGIEPSEAQGWLEGKTLNGILEEWRKAHSKPRGGARPKLKSRLSGFTFLNEALQAQSKHHDFAMSQLARVEQLIADAVQHEQVAETMEDESDA